MADRTMALGTLATVIAALLFSTKGVLVKHAYGYGVDPIILMGLRMGISLPFFVAFGWRARRADAPLTRRDLLATLGLGMLGYHAASWFDFEGLRFIGAGFERMILYLYPTVVVAIEFLRSRARPNPILIAALVLSYAGVVVTWGDEGYVGPDPVLGAALVGGSAVAYALFIVGSIGVITRIGSVRFISLAMICAAISLIAQALITQPLQAWQCPAPVYAYGTILAIGGTVIPAFLTGYGLRALGSQRFAVVTTVGPVATVLLAWATLGEHPSWVAALGMGMTVAGGLGVSLVRPSPATATAPVAAGVDPAATSPPR
jgi:drug/metabolite transporter (DMT)-like permease